ncbi:MAG: helix-turn-helix domain-containing protein [Candidatus Accumulibacter sp. UW26]|jgi:excisionase family DNA binding protein
MSLQKPQSLGDIIRQSAPLNELLTEQQAATLLHVTPGTLSVWRCTGRYSLPFVKVGRNVRYRLSDLNAWLESRTQTNGATA